MGKREHWTRWGVGCLGAFALGLLPGCEASTDGGSDPGDAAADAAADARAPAEPPTRPDALPELPHSVCGPMPLFAARPTPAGPDAWTLSGVSGDAAVLEGSCGGRGWESVLEFVAPAAGYWTFGFDADHTAFSGVVYLRTDCDALSTELACSVDDDRRWQLGVASADLAAGQHVFVVVDASSGRGGEYTLGVFRADAPIAPTITEARAFSFPDGRTTLHLSGTDPNGDVMWVRYVTRDADGHANDPRVSGDTPREVESLRATVAQVAPVAAATDLPADTATVWVALVDATGASSDYVEVPVRARPAVAEGAACDALGALSRCAADHVCVGDVGAATCLPATPPRIVSAHAYGRDDGALTFALAGEDTTRDATTFVAALLPENDDTPLVLDISGITEVEVYDLPPTGLATFERSGRMQVFAGEVNLADFPRATRVRLALLDALGARSAPAIVPIEAIPIVRVGEPCDHWRYTDRCEDSARCVSLYGGSEAYCSDVVPPELHGASITVQTDGRILFGVSGRKTEYHPLALDVFLVGDDGMPPHEMPEWHDLVYDLDVDPETGYFNVDEILVAGPPEDPRPVRVGDYIQAVRLKFVVRDVQGQASEPSFVPVPRQR